MVFSNQPDSFLSHPTLPSDPIPLPYFGESSKTGEAEQTGKGGKEKTEMKEAAGVTRPGMPDNLLVADDDDSQEDDQDEKVVGNECFFDDDEELDADAPLFL